MLDAMTWLGLDWDEGPEHRRPARPVPAEPARRDLPRGGRRTAGRRAPLRVVLDQRGRHGAAPGRRPRPEAGLRQLRPHTGSRADRGGHRGRPPAGAAAADARSGHHLRRPGPRPDHLPGRQRAGPGAGPRHRRPAVHTGQPGRRRADGHHPCAARRGPAAVDPAADRAVRGADRRSAGPSWCREFGHLPFVTGEGNRKLSKRDPQSNLFQYRDDGFITEGMVNYLALLGWSIGDDRDIFTPGRTGRRVRRPPDLRQPCAVRPQEGRGHQRRAHPAARRRTISRTGWWPTWSTGAAAGANRPPSSGRWSGRPRRWSRSAPRCCPRPRR